jgi:hypothetical protein
MITRNTHCQEKKGGEKNGGEFAATRTVLTNKSPFEFEQL